MATVEEVFKEHEICYIYNVTFRYYKEGEFTKKEAEKFCNDMNICKGGSFVIHPKGKYEEEYKLKMWLKNPISGGIPKKVIEIPMKGDFI